MPKGRLPPDIERLKARARAIVRRISEGEPVASSLVHISEVANILEARAGVQVTAEILSGLLSLSNLYVLELSKDSYEVAIEESRTSGVGVNDALASILMKKEGISEIYSFDKDYDRLAGLKRVAE